jgi:hypothetical protein
MQKSVFGKEDITKINQIVDYSMATGRANIYEVSHIKITWPLTLFLSLINNASITALQTRLFQIHWQTYPETDECLPNWSHSTPLRVFSWTMERQLTASRYCASCVMCEYGHEMFQLCRNNSQLPVVRNVKIMTQPESSLILVCKMFVYISILILPISFIMYKAIVFY